MVIEARKLKDIISEGFNHQFNSVIGEHDMNAVVNAFARSGNPGTDPAPIPLRSAEALIEIIDALSTFGYDQAAKEVYGVTYPEWKKRHQKRATEGQL